MPHFTQLQRRSTGLAQAVISGWRLYPGNVTTGSPAMSNLLQ